MRFLDIIMSTNNKGLRKENKLIYRKQEATL